MVLNFVLMNSVFLVAISAIALTVGLRNCKEAKNV